MDCAPDCCTFIYYAKAGLLELLERTFNTIYVTDPILKEIAEGKKEGKADAYILEKSFTQNKKYRIITTTKQELQEEYIYFKGYGEASLSIIIKKYDCIIITSDLTAYKKFIRRGITKLIRSDELLLIGLKKKYYTEQVILEKLVQLKAVGGTTEQRIAFLLSKLKKEKL